MGIHVKVDGKIKKVTGIYAGINGERKEILSLYTGTGGIVKKLYERKTTNPIEQKPIIFVAIGGEGKAYYSLDGGGIWQEGNGLDTTFYPGSVCFGNGMFVAVGTIGKSYYSIDGINWVAGNAAAIKNYCMDVTYGLGLFVAVAQNNTSYYSADGISWYAGGSLPKYSASTGNSSAVGIAFGDGRFVAGGNNGLSAYSTNGKGWSKTPYVGNGGISTGYNLSNIMFNEADSQFYAFCRIGGVYQRLISKNGTAWILTNMATRTYVGGYVIAASGKFYDPYNGGVLRVSSDGLSWDNTTPFDVGSICNIAHSNGRFIAVANTGKSYYSLNGEIWEESDSPPAAFNAAGLVYRLSSGEFYT